MGFTAVVTGEAIRESAAAPGRAGATSRDAEEGAATTALDEDVAPDRIGFSVNEPTGSSDEAAVAGAVTAALEEDAVPPDRMGFTAVNEPSASSRRAGEGAFAAALSVGAASPGRMGFSVKATGLLLDAELAAACTGPFAAARRRRRKKTRSASKSRNPPPAPAPIKTVEFEDASESPPGGGAPTG